MSYEADQVVHGGRLRQLVFGDHDAQALFENHGQLGHRQESMPASSCVAWRVIDSAGRFLVDQDAFDEVKIDDDCGITGSGRYGERHAGVGKLLRSAARLRVVVRAREVAHGVVEQTGQLVQARRAASVTKQMLVVPL